MLRLHSYRYHRPTALADALELLAEHGPSAMLIAGGTDLMPNMKHRLFTPEHLVGLKRVGELHGIEAGDDAIRIGAAETLTTISQDPTVRRHLPSLARAAGLVAGPQLRNMGTIGGNLCLDTRCTYYNQTEFWRTALGFCLKKDGSVCHVTKVGKKCVAAHSADTPPVLMTLGALAELASPRGTRAVPVADFFVADGIHNTLRAGDEIVTSLQVPLPSPATRTGFEKLRQRGAIDFPLLNAAVAVDFAEGDVVGAVRVVVSALGSRPRAVTGLDKVAAGQRLSPELIDAIALRAFEQSHPLENITVDTEWRRAMVPVLVRRALAQTLA
ncbi:MAG TPA: FAD binding domain-containing protein [Longimicrobiales bacterium]